MQDRQDPGSGKGPDKSPDDSTQKGEQRDPAAIWYDRFERKREMRMSPTRQRALKMLLLGAATAMLILGIHLRSEKMAKQMGSDRVEPANPIALLTRELDLDSERAERFFPLLQEYQKERGRLVDEYAELSEELDDLSAEHSPHNAEVQRLSLQLLKMEGRALELRRTFVERVGEQLDNWRAARLQLLVSVWDEPWPDRR